MMKYIFYICIILTFAGCTECDFIIPNTYRTFLKNYNVGDTIYFESNLGDIDTILIAKYDTMEVCGQGFMTGPRKHFYYEIKHLPKNNWTGGSEHSGNYHRILNQHLVVVEKTFDPNENSGFYTYIHYREFGGEVHDINNIISDKKFSDLGVFNYWKVKKSNYYEKEEIPDSIIHHVYWSTKYGLTAYEYGNGEMYKIKN